MNRQLIVQLSPAYQDYRLDNSFATKFKQFAQFWNNSLQLTTF